MGTDKILIVKMERFLVCQTDKVGLAYGYHTCSLILLPPLRSWIPSLSLLSPFPPISASLYSYLPCRYLLLLLPPALSLSLQNPKTNRNCRWYLRYMRSTFVLVTKYCSNICPPFFVWKANNPATNWIYLHVLFSLSSVNMVGQGTRDCAITSVQMNGVSRNRDRSDFSVWIKQPWVIVCRMRLAAYFVFTHRVFFPLLHLTLYLRVLSFVWPWSAFHPSVS